MGCLATVVSATDDARFDITRARYVSFLAGSTDGSTSGSNDGVGTAARFQNRISNCVVDPATSNVVMIDHSNHIVRLVDPITQQVTTVAGSAGVTGSTDGTGTAARFNGPIGAVLVDNGLAMVIADYYNHCLRKMVLSTYEVTTFAGLCGTQSFADGTGTAARFDQPFDLALDAGTGDIYTAEVGNHRIRKITSAAVVSTFLGTGVASTTASTCQDPKPVAYRASTATLYFGQDATSNKYYRYATGASDGTNLVGDGTGGSVVDGVGTAAQMNLFAAMTIHPKDDNLIFTFERHTKVRVINIALAWIYSPIGSGATTWSSGTPDASGMNLVGGGCFDAAGASLYVTGNFALSRVEFATETVSASEHLDGTRYAPVRARYVRFLAGTTDGTTSGTTDGVGTAARFNNAISGCVVDPATGDVVMTDHSNTQVRSLDPTSLQSATVAGAAGVYGGTDGVGTAARFNGPVGAALSDNGLSMVIADNGNHCLRKMVLSTFQVTTFAGLSGTADISDGTGTAARFNGPYDLALDADTWNIYVADSQNHRIRKVTPAAFVATIFGDGIESTSATRCAKPLSIAYRASTSTWYWGQDANSNRFYRYATSTSDGANLIGDGSQGTVDGVGTAAQINAPASMTIHPKDDNLIFTFQRTEKVRVINIDLAWIYSPIGSGATTWSSGTPDAAGMHDVGGGCFDASSAALYVTGLFAVARVEFATQTATPSLAPSATSTAYLDGTRYAPVRARYVRFLAGSTDGSTSGSTDGVGAAARFATDVSGCVVHPATGNVIVAEHSNHIVRLVDPSTQQVTTVAGSAGLTGTTDGTGAAARFNGPIGAVLVDNGFTMVVADFYNHCLRKILLSTYEVSTFAGLCGTGAFADGTGTAARFDGPYDLALDADTGDIYTADFTNNRIRKITSAAVSSTFFGTGTASTTASTCDRPKPVAYRASTATVYFGQEATSNKYYRYATGASDGTNLLGDGTGGSVVDGVGTSAVMNLFTAMTLHPKDDNLIFTFERHTNVRVINIALAWIYSPIGSGATTWSSGTADAAGMKGVGGGCFDAAGAYVYITGTYAISRAEFATQTQTTTASDHLDGTRYAPVRARYVQFLAGSTDGTTSGTADGVGTSARFNTFNAPAGCVVDPATGDVIIDDRNNHIIRRVDPATQEVTTVAGSAGVAGTTDGVGTAARFNRPAGATLADNGLSMVVAESNGDCLRKVVLATFDVTTFAGQCGTGAFADGTGTAARFDWLMDVGLDADTGNIYVADYANHRIRQVTPAAVVSTFFGTGTGSTTATTTKSPAAVAYRSSTSTVYFGQQPTGEYLYRSATGPSDGTNIIGDGSLGSVDGVGTSASVYYCDSMTLHPKDDNLIFTFERLEKIRVINIALAWIYSPIGSGATTWSSGTPDTAGMNNVNNGCFDTTGAYLYVVGEYAVSRVEFATETASASVPPTPASSATPSASSTAHLDGTRYAPVRARYVSFLAGSTDGATSGTTDGSGAAARFDGTFGGCSVDPATGDVIVAEHSNHVLRRVVPSTGQVTTIVGAAGDSSNADGVGTAARINTPLANALVDNGLSLLVSAFQSSCLRKVVLSTLEVTTFAGQCGTNAFADGTGTAARFDRVYNLALDADTGDVYGADYVNNRLRKITAAAVVSTFFGTGTGSTTTTTCMNPAALTYRSSTSTAYFGQQTTSLYYRSATGASDGTNIIGDGTAGTVDGVGTAARLNTPNGLVLSPTDDNVMFAFEKGNQVRVINIALAWLYSPIGSGATTWSSGTADAAGMSLVAGGCADPSGSSLYVLGSHAMSRVEFVTETASASVPPTPTSSATPSATSTAHLDGTRYAPVRARYVRFLAGSTDGSTTGSADGVGTAARFNSFVSGCAVDPATGDVVMIDHSNMIARHINPITQQVTTVAGSAGVAASTDGVGSAARFNGPIGAVLADGGLTIVVADFSGQCLRKMVLSTYEVTTFAGLCGTGAFADGTGTAARFDGPYDLALDAASGDVFVADSTNNRIRKVTPAAVSSTFFGTGTASTTTTTCQGPKALTYRSSTSTVYFGQEATSSRFYRYASGTSDGTNLVGDGTAATVDGVGTAAAVNLMATLTIHPKDDNLIFAFERLAKIRVINIALAWIYSPIGSGATTWSSSTPTAAGMNAVAAGCFDATGSYLYVLGSHAMSRVEFATETATPSVPPTPSISTTRTIAHTPTVTFAATPSHTLPPTMSLSRSLPITATLTLPSTPSVTRSPGTASASLSASRSVPPTPTTTGTETRTLEATVTPSHPTRSMSYHTATRTLEATLTPSHPTRSMSYQTPTLTLPKTVSRLTRTMSHPTQTRSLSETPSRSRITQTVSLRQTPSASVADSASQSLALSPSSSLPNSASNTAAVSGTSSLDLTQSAAAVSESSSLAETGSAALTPSDTPKPTRTGTLPPDDALDEIADDTGRTTFRFRRLSLARLDTPASAAAAFASPNSTLLRDALLGLAPSDAAASVLLVVRDIAVLSPASMFVRLAIASTDTSALASFDSALTLAVAVASSAAAPTTVSSRATVVAVPDASTSSARRIALTAYVSEFAPLPTLEGPSGVAAPSLVCSEDAVQLTAQGIARDGSTAPVVVTWSVAGANASLSQAVGGVAIATLFTPGTYAFTAFAVLENTTATASVSMERRAPLATQVAVAVTSPPSASDNGRLAAVRVTAPASASLEWSVLQGTAQLATPTAAATAVEGTDAVTLIVAVSDPDCGQVAYATVALEFTSLPTCTAAETCGGHGTCLESNACECFASSLFGFFDGLDCSRCAAGYTGAGCTQFACSASNCIHGTCGTDGTTCVCHRNASHGYWDGASCDECLVDPVLGRFAGTTCGECAPNYFPNGTCTTFCSNAGCGGHGACGGAGTCECFASSALGFWAGDLCDSCLEPFAGADCTQTCDVAADCSGHGTCFLDTAANAYQCRCAASTQQGFWTGAACDACAANYSGASCATFVTSDSILLARRIAECQASCVNGECDLTGACVCFATAEAGHWDGPNCDVCASAASLGFWKAPGCTACADGYFGSRCAQACPGLCSGRGECNVEGTCTCTNSAADGRWAGAACDECAPGYYGQDCTILCDASSCVGGSCDATGTCQCHSNATHGFWVGASCSRCRAGYDDTNGCRTCSAGRFGPECTPCTRAETCSGHGSCASDGSCRCDASEAAGFWAGAACDGCDDGYLPGCRVLVPTTPAAPACDGKVDAVWASARWRDGFIGVALRLSPFGGVDLAAQAAAYGVDSVELPGCDELFSAATLSAFGGAGLSCTWSGAEEVLVTFGSGATFGEGSSGASVTVTDGAVFAASSIVDCPSAVRGATLAVPLPEQITAVSAQAVSASLVGPCEGITVDASASTTPSPRVSFELAVVDANATEDLRAAVAAAVFDPVQKTASVPAWAVPGGTHTLRLTAVDAVTGLTGRVSFVVSKSAIPHPRVVIRGPSTVTFLASDGTAVVSDAFFSPCYNASGGDNSLAYVWTVVDRDGQPAAALVAASLQRAELEVAGGALSPALGPYVATLAVIDAASDGRGVASVTLVPEASPLSVRLTVPAGPAASTLLPVAWRCEDPDGGALSVAAACAGGCSAAVNDALSAAAAASNGDVAGLMRGSATLLDWAASGAANATWSVVCSGTGGRTASAAGSTLVAADDAAAPPPYVVSASQEEVSAGARWSAVVRINSTSQLPDGVAVSWACVAPCALNLSNAQTAPLGAAGSTLVIAEDRLETGTFTFTATVSSTAQPAAFPVTSASVGVVCRALPNSGAVSLSPAPAAFGPLASIRVTASGYVPGAPTLSPLTYAVAYVAEGGATTELAPQSASPTADIRLPGTQVWLADHIVVTVRDRIGGRTEVAVPLARVRGAVPSGDALLSDVTSATRRGSEGAVLSAVAAAAGSGASFDVDTTEQLASAITVPRGGGALAATAVAAVATSGAVTSGGSTAAVDSLATGLGAALEDVVRQGAGTSTTVVLALGATESLMTALANAATSAASSSDANATAGSRRAEAGSPNNGTVTAAERTTGALALTGRALMVQAAEGETSELSSGGAAVACTRGSGAATGAGVTSSAGAGADLGRNSLPAATDGAEASDLCVASAGGANPFAGVDREADIASAVVSITARTSAGTDLVVRDTPMRLRLPLASNESALGECSNATCSFYNTTLKAFDSRGCREVARTETELVCECDHLTDFGVRVNAPSVGNFEDIKLAGIVYVCVLTAMCAVFAVAAFVLDQRRQVSFVDALFSRSDAAERDLASGIAPAVYDAEAAEGQQSWLQAYLKTMGAMHPWVSPFMANPASNFTMPQRVMVLFTALVAQLFSTGLTFDPSLSTSDAAGLVRQIAAATGVGIPIVLASTTIVAFWFQRGQRSPADARHRHMRQRLAEADEAENWDDSNPIASQQQPPDSHEPFASFTAFGDEPQKTVSDSAAAAAPAADPVVYRLVAPSSARAESTAVAGSTTIHRFLRRSELRAVADSCAARRRHLASVSLHALAVADVLATRPDDQRPTTELAVARAVRLMLGYTSSSVREAGAGPGANRFPRPSAALNVILESYLGSPDPFIDPTFPSFDASGALERELYGDEMHGCAWRLAIECVKEHELALAEALFTMHLILELPDLYLVLFDAPAPRTLHEVLETVVAAARAPASSHSEWQHLTNVGRMWAAIYAQRLIFVVDRDAYMAALAASSPVTAPVVSMLLGLDGNQSPVIGAGCAAYTLAAEGFARAPAMGEVVGLSLEPVPRGQFCSLVMQAHALRLTPKPLVTELWRSRVSHRVRLSRAGPLDHIQAADAPSVPEKRPKSHASAALAAFHAQRCADVQPHMMRLSVVAEALASLPDLRIRQEKRHPLSFFAYSSAPVDADLGPTAWALRRLNKPYYDQLYLRETTHGNFFATIECGRLMAMLLNRRTGAHPTFDQFARAFQREVADLVSLNAASIRYDSSLPSWRHAAGGGRRDVTKEVIGSNLVVQTGVDRSYNDPVLHECVMNASMTGGLDVPDFLREALASTAVRIAVPPSRVGDFPLASLARFQPPAAAGCGTPTAPHIGITAATRAARLGECIELIEGRYMPVTIRHTAGTLARPLVISPFGYDAMLWHREDDAFFDAVGEDDLAAQHPPRPAAADDDEDADVEDDFDDAGAAEQAGGEVTIYDRPLRAEERALLHRCILSSPLGARELDKDDAPVITLDHCAHIRVRGLELRQGTVGVVATECTDVQVEHCLVATALPSSSDTDPVLDEAVNEVITGAGKIERMTKSGALPPRVAVVGYVLFAVLYLFFGLFTLFITAGLDDNEANTWLAQSALSTAIVALVVQPLAASAVASFVFANEVVMVAISQLSPSAPSPFAAF